MGDQILEINGINVINKMPTEIVQLLAVPEYEDIIFKLIPHKDSIGRASLSSNKSFVRCMVISNLWH